MQINNNIPNYQNQYLEQNKALQKIATGLSINQSSDNPASQAIADVLRTQASGYTQAISNTNSAVASVQIADNAMNEQSRILDNINQKLIQASNGTISQDGRDAILKDIQKMMQNFDDIASNTNYNGQNLLQKSEDDQASSESQSFLVGNNGENTIQTSQIQSNSLGVGLEDLKNLNPADFDANTARSFLSQVSNAMDTIGSYRSELGSVQNQLESAGLNLISQQIQTQNAQSEIVGANIAQSIASFDRQNILSQVGSFVQSQSNANQQAVLRLLT